MNLKLRIILYWTPEFLLIPELDHVAKVTIECLNQLLKKYAPQSNIPNQKLVMKGSINERRKTMAIQQNIRVQALIKAIGYEEALNIGKKALFNTGVNLGREIRQRLGVNDNLGDLIRAARVLYRVLGIKFHIKEENEDDDKITLIIEKCMLSKYYTPETCQVLSAADEGVVQGLNPNFSLNFCERITEGSNECVACIDYKECRREG